MCGGGHPVQLGVPLNDEAFAGMSEEERAFWLDFLEEAKRVLMEMAESGAEPPYEPTPSLREKYQRALEQYNGSIYCQMAQLKHLFTLEQAA